MKKTIYTILIISIFINSCKDNITFSIKAAMISIIDNIIK